MAGNSPLTHDRLCFLNALSLQGTVFEGNSGQKGQNQPVRISLTRLCFSRPRQIQILKSLNIPIRSLFCTKNLMDIVYQIICLVNICFFFIFGIVIFNLLNFFIAIFYNISVSANYDSVCFTDRRGIISV